MDNFPTKVKDIGEQGLLPRLQRFCPPEIIGDDAAVIPVKPEQLLVVTTDVLVDKVHFSEQTTPPESVGWRAVAANLSDLAAMGASPLGITVGLSLPGDVNINWLEHLYQGMFNCVQQYQTYILGGDVCRSSVITIAITAFGQVLPKRVIRRFSAQIGDAIVVTGYHGNSRAGLELLLHPEIGVNLDVQDREYLIAAHQKPKPRLDVVDLLGQIFDEFKKKEQQTITSFPSFYLGGMDSSDGLADALIQICRCSGVGAEIERNCIPLSPALEKLVAPEQGVEWALYGGEDFELILAVPQPIAELLVERLAEGAAIIGRVTAEKEVKVIDSNGNYSERLLTLTEGFQHF